MVELVARLDVPFLDTVRYAYHALCTRTRALRSSFKVTRLALSRRLYRETV